MILNLYPISLIASYKFCLSNGKEIDLHTYTETKEKSAQLLQNADILIPTHGNILAQFNKGRIKTILIKLNLLPLQARTTFLQGLTAFN